MKKIIHVNFLYQYGEEFQTNLGPCAIKKEWLDTLKNDMFKHKVFLEMHSWYPAITSDIWLDRDESREISSSVMKYSNPGHYVGPIIYTDDTGINVLLDDENKYNKHDAFIELLKENKPFATCILKTDDEKTEIIGVKKICLCLGLIDNQILFV